VECARPHTAKRTGGRASERQTGEDFDATGTAEPHLNQGHGGSDAPQSGRTPNSWAASPGNSACCSSCAFDPRCCYSAPRPVCAAELLNAAHAMCSAHTGCTGHTA
jgi:hypothetical protein